MPRATAAASAAAAGRRREEAAAAAALSSLVAAAAILLMSAVPVRAQAVTVRFHDGLVTLTARNAPLRAILAEWARLGGTTIVNGERVAGPPLTLELNAVSERQALDVILRTVSGYMLGARPAGALQASSLHLQ